MVVIFVIFTLQYTCILWFSGWKCQ